MEKIAIVGGGISGLSVAQMLKEKYEIKVFEGASRPGGLIKCERIDGNLYHTTGGHVFNTKRSDVLEWFWSFFDKEKEFTLAKRNASIFLQENKFIPYPIENNFHLLSESLISKIIKDLLKINKSEKITPLNFKEFLKQQFGETLFDIYFKPYNEKIWQCDLAKIPLSWLEGKLPMPTVEEIFTSNITKAEENKFVHSSFYYPQEEGSQFLIDRLTLNLDIHCNHKVESIERIGLKWQINRELFDRVIFCGNIKQLPAILNKGINISRFSEEIDSLEYHGTTTVLCEVEKNPYSWVYLPDSKIRPHRIICTGNFSKSNNAVGKMSATIEFTDFISEEEIIKNLELLPFSPKYLLHHYEQFTYPIQHSSTREMVNLLKTDLEKDNFYLLGRFAEWEYYNMDAAIGAAIDLTSNF
ncbi:MAG: NAD(P)-binding protein [Carboxylicivirga sp.]|jgi:protoporphyrinogen oxidase|nr:NAD(P)-binding protein [Carboxylicivirga sp.]